MVKVLQNSVDQAQISDEYVFWAEKSVQVGPIAGEVYIGASEVPSKRCLSLKECQLSFYVEDNSYKNKM